MDWYDWTTNFLVRKFKNEKTNCPSVGWIRWRKVPGGAITSAGYPQNTTDTTTSNLSLCEPSVRNIHYKSLDDIIMTPQTGLHQYRKNLKKLQIASQRQANRYHKRIVKDAGTIWSRPPMGVPSVLWRSWRTNVSDCDRRNTSGGPGETMLFYKQNWYKNKKTPRKIELNQQGFTSQI